ncbi:hypothetical protein ON010_g1541 [Phytophthora cinnamomi]|nr:hypothetical protein ON010_g1541 [Phytophthora cinnamomi]
METLSRFEVPNAPDNSDLLDLEDVDDELLLRDAEELLATFAKKKLPLSGAERRERSCKRQKSEHEATGPQRAAGLVSQAISLNVEMKEKRNRIVADAWQNELRGAVADQAALIVDVQDMISRRMRRGKRGDVEKLLSLTQTERFPLGGFNTVMKGNGDVEYFEIAGVKHLPFGYQSVCEIAWEVISLPHRQTERRLHNASAGCENEFAVQFRVICPQDLGEDVVFTTHFVAKRCTEQTHTVMVWRGLMEGEGEFAGLRMEETGWCVVSSELRGVSDGPLTMVQKYARVVPLHFNAPKAKVHEFSELILRCLHEVDSTIAALIGKLRNKAPDDVVAVVEF